MWPHSILQRDPALASLQGGDGFDVEDVVPVAKPSSQKHQKHLNDSKHVLALHRPAVE